MSPGSFTRRSMQLNRIAALRYGVSLMSASVAEAASDGNRTRGGRRRARVRTAEGDGEPPLVAESEGDWPWRAEGNGEKPRRRATTTEGFGNRQGRVRSEHRRELATIERGGVGQWRAKANTRTVGGKVTMVLVHCRSSMIMRVPASYSQPCR
jgi:hypothetical protein